MKYIKDDLLEFYDNPGLSNIKDVQIWVDDIQPPQYEFLMDKVKYPVLVARTFSDFKKIISNKDINILYISFDDDLDVSKSSTSYECGQILMEKHIQSNTKLPHISTHSTSPGATNMILALLNEFDRKQRAFNTNELFHKKISHEMLVDPPNGFYYYENYFNGTISQGYIKEYEYPEKIKVVLNPIFKEDSLFASYEVTIDDIELHETIEYENEFRDLLQWLEIIEPLEAEKCIPNSSNPEDRRRFDEHLDDVHPLIQIGNCTFYPSEVLKNCDPIAYETYFDEVDFIFDTNYKCPICGIEYDNEYDAQFCCQKETEDINFNYNFNKEI